MYEPEGIDVVRAHDPMSFAERYSRMDPEAGKAMRKLVLYYRPNAPSGNASDSGTSNPGSVTADDGDEEYSHVSNSSSSIPLDLLTSATPFPPFLPIQPRHVTRDIISKRILSFNMDNTSNHQTV